MNPQGGRNRAVSESLLVEFPQGLGDLPKVTLLAHGSDNLGREHVTSIQHVDRAWGERRPWQLGTRGLTCGRRRTFRLRLGAHPKAHCFCCFSVLPLYDIDLPSSD